MIRKVNGVYVRPDCGLTQSDTISLSGAAVDFITNYIFMEADQFKTGDIIRLRTFWNKTGTTDSATLRFYFNTSLSTTGATQLGVYTFPAANRSVGLNRKICFLSPSSGVIISTSFNVANSDGDYATTISTVSISNWLTSSGYFFVTVNRPGLRLVDSVSCLYLSLEL